MRRLMVVALAAALSGGAPLVQPSAAQAPSADAAGARYVVGVSGMH